MGNCCEEIKLFPKQRLADRWMFVGDVGPCPCETGGVMGLDRKFGEPYFFNGNAEEISLRNAHGYFLLIGSVI